MVKENEGMEQQQAAQGEREKEREIYARRPCSVLQRGIVGKLLGVKITRSPYLFLHREQQWRLNRQH